MKKVLFLLVFQISLNAQIKPDLNYYLGSIDNYDASIPTPASVIGHEVGTWHITHDKLVQYMRKLAASSSRIELEDRGVTYEGRPLLLLKITSEDNHSKLDQIKKNHLSATTGKSPTNTQRPIVVYQGFSIHGNEASGSNAALLLAYHLAASKTNSTKELLKNVVVLLDPSLNPDGLQRFAHWVNSHKSVHLNPDPQDREYREHWPGGRTNHYWFDMNRDWLPAQLPESQARLKTFYEWMPNILTDHHEMGTNSTFFFQPGVASRTHPLTPRQNQELTRQIGLYHAAALDNIGSLYYSGENFDDFYYGKGSTFPDIAGGIGILFEQASSRGHVQESVNGTLTFPFTIRNQLTTALSTLDAAVDLKDSLLNYQNNFFADALKQSDKDKNMAYIFGSQKNKANSVHLAEILSRHQIEIYKLSKNTEINGVKFLKDKAYLVPKHQKNSRILRAMFEKRTVFKDSLFYDVSAWSMPHAFDLDFSENATIRSQNEKISEIKLPNGSVNKKSDYAYAFEWHEYYAPKLLNKILNSGLRAKVGLKPFKTSENQFDYGSIIIPVQNQKYDTNKLYLILKQFAEESHLKIFGLDTGLNEGPDLGSGNFKPLKPIKVGLLVGDGVTAYDAGEIWHLLDTRFQMKITKLEIRNLVYNNLDKYSSIILPNSRPLDDKTTLKLKSWVERGGNLIAYRNSIKWLNDKGIFKIKFKENNIDANNVSFENKEKFYGAQRIGGAIFNTKLDRSHPINFGYADDNLSVFKNTTLFMEMDKSSYNNPISYTSDPLVSGYVSKDNLALIKNSSALKIKHLKKGTVVAFVDNTNFRGFWYGTNKLLLNALFFKNIY